MKRRVGRPKAGQSTLTREIIIGTALKMVDENGIEAFSMRKLAGKLGVDPMAVYYHLKNKKAVLDALVKKAFDFTSFEACKWGDESSMDWKEAIKCFARFYIGLFRNHRHLALYLVANAELGTESIQQGNERLFSALRAGGLKPTAVIQAADIIIDYLNGYALAESTGRLPNSEQRTLQYKQWLSEPESYHYPTTREVVQAIDGNMATDFEMGLACILAGVGSLQTGDGALVDER